jgi:alkylresorcinol/alkylpyrone synthase
LTFPKILSLATEVPDHVMSQDDALALGRHLFAAQYPSFTRFEAAYANAGIDKRHICVPVDWLYAPHDWKECNDIYLSSSLALLRRAATAALNDAGLNAADIDGIVTVSSTGLATPSLDARLGEELPFRADARRVPIFGLGCAGGVTGLARTADFARATPGSKWLLLVVELCSLTFRPQDTNKSNIIATALFGDGAAAAVVSTEGDGPGIAATGEHRWPDSLYVMGWHIEDDGFGVLFSRDIPSIVREELLPPLGAFLKRAGKKLADIDDFAFHPGGTKVLAALEKTLAPKPPGFEHARAVMRENGNMSAPTALFVLDRARNSRPLGDTLMAALGPGFTASFLMLESG